MERRKTCKNKSKPNQSEKLMQQFSNDSSATDSAHKKPSHLLDLGVPRENRIPKKSVQNILVTIKQRTPTNKRLYLSNARKVSGGSCNLLGVGNHQSIRILFSNEHHAATPISISTDHISSKLTTELDAITENEDHHQPSKHSYGKCNGLGQGTVIPRRTEKKQINSKAEPISTGKTTTTAKSAKSAEPKTNTLMNKWHPIIRRQEKKSTRVTLVDPKMSLSSSDDENKETQRYNAVSKRPGCSYIEHYSHIPESGAFQRRPPKAGPHTPNKTTTIQKEHNSEQYSRDFTTYDGITARGHRHCASMPSKRDDGPRLAAERMHKMRHKLNPVRDYRLLDTVHYLAQGEFAPRDDGIKLTPSREAVLSDIIYEDVCRTHWPNTRLNQRHRDRRGVELQRLIDSMLRERVAHVERRRRRHYRIVKLNHRHDNCSRPLGKTGDIIVASHKNRSDCKERDATASARAVYSFNSAQRWTEYIGRGRSDRRNREQRRNYEPLGPSPDECNPGPSTAVRHSIDQNTNCYYHSYYPDKIKRGQPVTVLCKASSNFASRTSFTGQRQPRRSARTRKKEPLAPRCTTVKEQNLEQFILLPTLVPRTQSNLKRQTKFNKLYHRILSAKERIQNKDQVCLDVTEPKDRGPKIKVKTRDIGLNVNVTLYKDDSDDDF